MQESISALIKKIRKENNLTQKEFADKYNVTYQAVSKWENGINIPDMSILSSICKDYNISLDELLSGNKKKNNLKIIYIIVLLLLILIVSVFIIYSLNRKETFNFMTLSSNCSSFTVKGTLAYDSIKSSIYITSINYCGEENNKEYQYIECVLYEEDDSLTKKISTYSSNPLEGSITLEEFLKSVTMSIDNYDKMCDNYSNDSFYLEINATDENEEVTTHKIPLSIDSCE